MELTRTIAFLILALTAAAATPIRILNLTIPKYCLETPKDFTEQAWRYVLVDAGIILEESPVDEKGFPTQFHPLRRTMNMQTALRVVNMHCQQAIAERARGT